MIENLKPYPETKDSGLPWLREVPAHWEMKRNGGLFQQCNDPGNSELPILEVSLRTGVRVRDFAASKRKQVMTDRSKYKRAGRGDLVYNMMRMWQGAAGIAPVNGLVSPAYVVCRAMPGIDSGYFSRLFKTVDYLAEIDAASRGIVKDRNRLYWDQFKQICSPLPPASEQAAIARFLAWATNRLDRAIGAKRRIIALLQEQKQAIIHRAVTQGLDPSVPLKDSGIPWLGEIPEHWEVWRISLFAAVGNGSTPSRGEPRFWVGGTYPWLNSAQINRGHIDSADQFVTSTALRDCHLPKVKQGSILVAITGQGKTRGMSAVLAVEATISQHLAFITPRTPIATSDFLNLAMTAAYSQLRAISEDSGSTKGALTCEDIKRFHLPIPPEDVQADLINRVKQQTDGILKSIAHHELEIILLCEYRTRLIADVVTGKLDVREVAAGLPEEIESDDAQDATEEDLDLEDEVPENLA